MFEFDREFKHWVIVQTEFVQYLVTGLPHDGGARVHVFVNAVAETHEPERIGFVLGAFDEFADAADIADFFQHLQSCFIGTTMSRPPKRCDAGCDASKRVGAA